MATIGVSTSVGSVGPSGTPDVSNGNFYCAGQTPWGIDGTYQVCTSMGQFNRLYGALNRLVAVGTPDLWSYETADAAAQLYYNVKQYFAEKQAGSPGVLYFSRVVASTNGPVAASGTFNDVTTANPTTIASKWKAAAGNTVAVTIQNPAPRASFNQVGVGTLATTSASGSVTGTGTAFALTDVGKGILIGGVPYVITARSTATAITISPVASATLASASYAMAQPSCQIVASFPQANITETWPIFSATDAANASYKSEIVTITLPAGGTLPATSAATKLTGGSDGTTSYSASDADYVGTVTAANVKSGLQVFNDMRLGLGYVAVPGKYSAVVRTGVKAAAEGPWRLGLLSAPSGLTLSTVAADPAGLSSNLCAYYAPQVKVNDENSQTGGTILISNEGSIAGLAAKMIRDYNGGPHKSPAGKLHPFSNVVDIEKQSNGQELYDDAASNTLADSSINTIRVKKGFVVWGNRTLANDRRWLQFNAAQTNAQVIVTGQAILEKFIFEPIDDILFGKVKSDFKVMLHDLFGKGALYGDEPGQNPTSSDAYLVVCDRTNNPDSVVVNNEFRVDVTFVPKPNAEKVTFTVSPAAPGFAGRAAQ